MVTPEYNRKFARRQRLLNLVGKMPAQTGNTHRGRMTLGVGGEQRLAPVDAWMVCQFVPCLRMVECDRTILAAGILRAQAAGRTDNAE
jgi:hypothetical protein